MECVESIIQNANTGALPNFRNLGILLRILIIVDAMCLAAALVKAGEPLAMMEELVDISALVQPILILSLLLLALGNHWLRGLPYLYGLIAVFVLEAALTTAVYYAGQSLYRSMGPLERYWLFALLITAVLAGYFELRGRALSPALAEARLQALQARIRPHFLFNSINAVLSLIRQDARRAEHALEDLADLFRVLMADNRQLVPLAREIDLCHQYLNLEQLRLGERLRVEWDTASAPADALIPPLVLQPLLENAVYHGIEPRSEPGTIEIRARREGEQLKMTLCNPYREGQVGHVGNRMALANVRERLALHYDAEANIRTFATGETYEVDIVIPYLKGGA